MVRVQSVTWVADYGRPCDWWWLDLLSPSDPSIKGFGHPLIPCQALGQAFDSSPIKGEGIRLVLSCCHPTLWILP